MRKNKYVFDMTLIALTAALLSVSALVCIPLAVPITLQTLVLFSSLFILGGRRTSIAALVYILIGAVGVPVFSGFGGGIARLLDATGGYIFGLLLSSLLYWLLERPVSSKLLSAALSLLLIYTVGTVWYAFVYAGGADSIGAVLIACVVPFIVPDVIKISLSYVIAKRIPRLH